MVKIYLSTENDCYVNQAIERKLFRRREPALYFWVNGPCVVLGANQNVYREVDTAYAAAHGIAVARRLSGGGAVYHDLGNLNYTYFSSVLDDTLVALITAQLRRFAIPATFSGRNDLCIDGKKVSGLAYYGEDGFYLVHGCLLFAVDLAQLEQVLSPRWEVATGAIKSRPRALTMIKDHAPLSIAEFIASFPGAVVRLDRSFVTEEEIAFFADRTRIFASPGPFTLKLVEQGVELYLTLDGAIIKNIALYHDFLDYDFNLNEFLETEFAPEKLRAAIAAAYARRARRR